MHKILKQESVQHALREYLYHNRFVQLERKERFAVEQFAPLFLAEKHELSSRRIDIAYTKYFCFHLESYIH